MRVKPEERISRSKNTSFEASYRRIVKLGEYTYLNSPLPDSESDRQYISITKNLSRISGHQNLKISGEWTKLMTCFDGGDLFGTLIYSMYDYPSEDDSYDIQSANEMLWSAGDLDDRYIAIAMLDYGNFIVMSIDGSEAVHVWDPIEKCITGSWNNIGAWLNEECDVAERFIQEGLLHPIKD